MPVINQLIMSKIILYAPVQSRVLFASVMMAFAINGVVRGYHIYKEIWSAEIDSELPCCPESGNHED